MSWILPRGESASSPRIRKVGQSFRQRPQEMQVARSSARTWRVVTVEAIWIEMSLG